MAEQALVADLRIGLTKFDADLRKAMQSADKASANISQALNRVDNSVKQLPAEFNKLNNSLRQTEQATNRAAQASEKQSQIMGKLKGALGALGLLVTAQQMIQFATSTVRAAEAMTGVNQQLVKLTGSAKAAQDTMTFIRLEANRLALNTVDAAQGFARLANAAKGTRIEGEGTRRIFQSLNELARANRLSTDEYGRVLNQVTQIIAKGKVQTEELITLSESGIPAFRLLGEAMGVTGKRLAEMLQKGQVSSDNMLLLADKIHKEYASLAEAAANTLPAKFARGFNMIKQEFVDLATGVLASSELIKAVDYDPKAILDIFPNVSVITSKTDEIIREMVLMGELIRVVFEKMKEAVVRVFTGLVDDIKSVLGPIDTWIQEKFAKIPGVSALKNIFGKDIKEGIDAATESATKMGNAIAQTIQKVNSSSLADRLKFFQSMMKDLRESLKIDDAEILDARVTGPAAAKAAEPVRGEWLDVLKEIKESATRVQPLIDPVTEAEAARTIASMRKQVRREELAEQERQEQAIRQMQRETSEELKRLLQENEDRIAKGAALAEQMAEDALLSGKPILGDAITEAEKRQIAELEKTIENLKENLQSALAGTISEALRGDIDNIEDVADQITKIFTDTAANIAAEFISAFVIDPIVNQLKAAMAQLKGVVGAQGSGADGGEMTVGGQVVGGIGAIGAGVGVGYGVSNMAGGGKKGGALGGAAGGAVAGATIGGMSYGPVGALVGAAIGAIVGGVMGYLSAKDPVKTSLRMQTTAGEPASSENMARGRSPFGIISLFDESKASKEVSNAATLAISEIDAGIAKHLDSRQREIVQNYFQSAVPEGLQVESKNVGDAIAKAVQQRFYHAITALEGEDTAKAVVGELYTATSQNIGAITARAMEALEILATIADFKAGDLSQTAQQIKAINDQFQQLKDRATVLGLPTQEIEAEQQKQLAKITKDFNQDIGDAILGITDPVKLEFVELERMQEERRQNAIDAGADLTELAKLEQLEREELEKKHQTNLTELTKEGQKQREAALNTVFQAIYAITDPFKAAILGVQLQVAQFQQMVDQGLIPQSVVDRFEDTAMDDVMQKERERKAEEAQMVEDFNQGIYDSLLGMKDANALELEQMDRMHAERYSEAIRLGADLTAVAQLNHAERLQLEQEHQDELTALQQQAQQAREDALGNVFMMIWQIEDPFKAVLLSIEQQVDSLQEQVDAGLIPQSLVDRFENDALNQAYEKERERRMQEAENIQQFNDDIAISIMRLTDSAAAEQMEMDLIHADRLRRAEELGADISAVEELNRLEREDSARRHEEELTRIAEDAQRAVESATDNIFQAIFSIVGGLQSGLYSLLQQIQSFGEQAAAGLISWDAYNMFVDVGINDALQKDREQKAREQEDRQRAAQQAADQARRVQEQRRREAEQRAAQNQREAEQRRREAQQRAAQKQREAEQRKREAEQRKREREQEAERRRQDAMRFNSALLGFTDPAKEAMNQVNEQVREFRQMTKEGIISKKAVDQFARLATASARIDQALQAISGGGGSPIEQVGDAFKSFIQAGSPEKSQSVQAMEKLQEQFSGLAESAKMLGLSTKDLEKSYINQARVIREDAIKAINEEMDAKKEQLKQIDEFLAGMRMSDVLPPNLRFNEARAQFGEAVKGGDVQKAVSASEQYLNVAQQQFGTTQQFFSVRNEVERMLTNLRDQQASNIEAERQKLIMQEERQLEQVRIGRSSVDYLKRISSDNSATSRGIEQLIAIARSQTSEQVQTRQLLLRLASKIKA